MTACLHANWGSAWCETINLVCLAKRGILCIDYSCEKANRFCLASFPASPHILEVTESWAGPGLAPNLKKKKLYCALILTLNIWPLHLLSRSGCAAARQKEGVGRNLVLQATPFPERGRVQLTSCQRRMQSSNSKVNLDNKLLMSAKHVVM